MPADASRETKVGNPVPGSETVGTGAGARALEGVSPKADKVTCRGGKALPSGRENSWIKKRKIKEVEERANYCQESTEEGEEPTRAGLRSSLANVKVQG